MPANGGNFQCAGDNSGVRGRATNNGTDAENKLTGSKVAVSDGVRSYATTRTGVLSSTRAATGGFSMQVA